MHLVCGEALYDLFLGPGDGGDVAIRAVAGGSPFNVAVGMARLGAAVALGSDLAHDALGRGLADRLTREGVDDRFLRRTAAHTALAFVSTDAAGSPSYSFQSLDAGCFYPDPQLVERHLPEITGLHLGSIALVLPRSAPGLANLGRMLVDRALISLDPNVRLAIEPDRRRWLSAIERVRPFVHLIKISEEDVAALYGHTQNPDLICEGWLDAPTELVILTRGARGASLFSRAAGRVDVAAFPAEVVDTVGAGDSFMAATLVGLVREDLSARGGVAGLGPRRLEAIGRSATAAAALTCSRRGPVLPWSDEIARLTPAGAARAAN